MPVYELHVDNAATVDVTVHPAAFPIGTVKGDLIAIRPANVGKGKAKDRPLLFKVDTNPPGMDQDDHGASASSHSKQQQQQQQQQRRTKAHVVVSGTVAQNFSWIKSRQDVFISLVSQLCSH
jgi:hypothetical protein